jgi:hypothetical protein
MASYTVTVGTELHQESATLPDEKATPSATTPVPETPLTSSVRISRKRRMLSPQDLLLRVIAAA